jgi:hypothetical protein
MFEDLNDGLQALQERGIAVGKVQISNALNVDFNSTDKLDEIGKALEAFREPRWLHQTVIQDGGKQRFYEDLELALAHEKSPHGQWRIHFHVPVHIQSIGPLGTTHAQMLQSIRRLQVHPGPIDWEVETYAWSALPQQLQPDTLSEGIAAELQWVQGLIADETVP